MRFTRTKAAIGVALATLVAWFARRRGSSERPTGSEGPAPDDPAGTSGADERFTTKLLHWTKHDGLLTLGAFDLYASEATFELDGDQGIIVTVMGPSSAAVDRFTAEARFDFELAGPLADTPDHTRVEPDRLPHGDLADHDSESLLIELQLTDAAWRERPDGTLIGVIDPSVAHHMFHNFYVKNPANPAGSNDTVTSTLTVSGGEVEARLYRRCLRVAAVDRRSTQPAAAISDTGSGNVDLAVFGTGYGSNTYQLRGEWPYWYGANLPSQTAARITC